MDISAPAVVGATPPISLSFARRIRTAYRHSMNAFGGSGNSMWADIQTRQADVHQTLMGNDDGTLVIMLSNPGATDLFFGMDSNVRGDNSSSMSLHLAHRAWIGMAALAEAVGSVLTPNPEHAHPAPALPSTAAEDVLAGIDQALKWKPDFPNPFPGEVGFGTSRGIAIYRSANAIYQAHLLKGLSARYGGRVLEIGAGLGRTAYYAIRAGLGPYSIIDIPMSNVAQALFLGATLGEERVRLSGEANSGQDVEILDVTSDFPRVDIVLNADSLTELDPADAGRYAGLIQRNSKVFLSINHEVNLFRVFDLGDLVKQRVSRNPYWLRPGYVVEVYKF